MKVQPFVACVNTGKSKPEIFRMAEEVEMGGHDDVSESLEESRSGDGRESNTVLRCTPRKKDRVAVKLWPCGPPPKL